MVLQPLADAGQGLPHFHADRAQQIRRADSEWLQQMRRANRARAQDNLAARTTPAVLDSVNSAAYGESHMTLNPTANAEVIGHSMAPLAVGADQVIDLLVGPAATISRKFLD
jgi:hypothetical protein